MLSWDSCARKPNSGKPRHIFDLIVNWKSEGPRFIGSSILRGKGIGVV
jgi:hypothetical protein